MNNKIGRNDPCPCGSGKKFKQCCLPKQGSGKKKITAKWINRPEVPNLMERTFGKTIAEGTKEFQPISDNDHSPSESEK